MSWFKTWFNSKYYHKLYKNRDHSEADSFIDNLNLYLKTNDKNTALDLACGKGRHSIKLNSLGLKVWGCDLSEESINEAKNHENETLHFFIHDMRNSFENLPKLDFVLNLFTSFGYFENHEDNLKTLINIKNSLKNNGVFVQDFFNSNKIIGELKNFEEKLIDNTLFKISKKTENNFIIKDIEFVDEEGETRHFQEKVEAISLNQFKELYEKAGLKITSIKGNYNLDEFNEEKSERLILFSQPQIL